MSTSLTPTIVRKLMPSGFLKTLKEQHEKATGRTFTEAMVSYVVKNGRVNHPIWPLAVKLAQKEMKRLKREQENNAQLIRAMEA